MHGLFRCIIVFFNTITLLVFCVLGLTVVTLGVGMTTLGVLSGTGVGVTWVWFVSEPQPLSSAPSGHWGKPSQRCAASIQPPGGGHKNWPLGQPLELWVGYGRVPKRYKTFQSKLTLWKGFSSSNIIEKWCEIKYTKF